MVAAAVVYYSGRRTKGLLDQTERCLIRCRGPRGILNYIAGRDRNIAINISVCLSASISQKPDVQNLQHFQCMLHVTVARYFLGFFSCMYYVIFAHMLAKMVYGQTDLPGGSTGSEV